MIWLFWPKTTTVMACAGLLAAVPTGPRGSPVSVVSSYGMKSKTKPQPREAKAGFEVVARGTVPPLRDPVGAVRPPVRVHADAPVELPGAVPSPAFRERNVGEV